MSEGKVVLEIKKPFIEILEMSSQRPNKTVKKARLKKENPTPKKRGVYA